MFKSTREYIPHLTIMGNSMASAAVAAAGSADQKKLPSKFNSQQELSKGLSFQKSSRIDIRAFSVEHRVEKQDSERRNSDRLHSADQPVVEPLSLLERRNMASGFAVLPIVTTSASTLTKDLPLLQPLFSESLNLEGVDEGEESDDPFESQSGQSEGGEEEKARKEELSEETPKFAKLAEEEKLPQDAPSHHDMPPKRKQPSIFLDGYLGLDLKQDAKNKSDTRAVPQVQDEVLQAQAIEDQAVDAHAIEAEDEDEAVEAQVVEAQAIEVEVDEVDEVDAIEAQGAGAQDVEEQAVIAQPQIMENVQRAELDNCADDNDSEIDLTEFDIDEGVLNMDHLCNRGQNPCNESQLLFSVAKKSQGCATLFHGERLLE